MAKAQRRDRAKQRKTPPSRCGASQRSYAKHGSGLLGDRGWRVTPFLGGGNSKAAKSGSQLPPHKGATERSIARKQDLLPWRLIGAHFPGPAKPHRTTPCVGNPRHGNIIHAAGCSRAMIPARDTSGIALPNGRTFVFHSLFTSFQARQINGLAIVVKQNAFYVRHRCWVTESDTRPLLPKVGVAFPPALDNVRSAMPEMNKLHCDGLQ